MKTMKEPSQRGRWLRLIAEGAAIVISILLAFAIDAWWDGRQDRIEEAEILGGLEQEFAAYQREFSARAAATQHTMRVFETVLTARSSSTSTAPSPAVSDSLLSRLLFFPILDPARGTLDALIMSGRLELIGNRDLRTLLASWSAVVGDIRDNELDRRQFTNTVVAPLLLSRAVPLDRALSVRTDWPVPTLTEFEIRQAYERLIDDAAFQSIVALVYARAANTATEYSGAADYADQVLGVLRAELHSTGFVGASTGNVRQP